jgi:hypothetical protein
VYLDFEEKDLILLVVVERLYYLGRPQEIIMLGKDDIPSLVIQHLFVLFLLLAADMLVERGLGCAAVLTHTSINALCMRLL